MSKITDGFPALKGITSLMYCKRNSRNSLYFVMGSSRTKGEKANLGLSSQRRCFKLDAANNDVAAAVRRQDSAITN